MAGRRIAERNCGGCHAVRGGLSPEPAAPPFTRLHALLRPGQLAQILEQGMIPPLDPLKDEPVVLHPKMPRTVLGADELAKLSAYLDSLAN